MSASRRFDKFVDEFETCLDELRSAGHATVSDDMERRACGGATMNERLSDMQSAVDSALELHPTIPEPARLRLMRLRKSLDRAVGPLWSYYPKQGNTGGS